MTWQYVVFELGKLIVPLIGLTITSIFAYLAHQQSKQNSSEINAARQVQAYHESQLDSIGAKVDEAKQTAKKVADKVGADKPESKSPTAPKRVGGDE